MTLQEISRKLTVKLLSEQDQSVTHLGNTLVGMHDEDFGVLVNLLARPGGVRKVARRGGGCERLVVDLLAVGLVTAMQAAQRKLEDLYPDQANQQRGAGSDKGGGGTRSA